jgi:hypothetical protein
VGGSWKGVYDDSTAYAVNDLVTYTGATYVCIQLTTGGHNPSDAVYWSSVGGGLGSTPSTQVFGDTAVGGSAATASRNDHKHSMMANPVNSQATGFTITSGTSAQTLTVTANATISGTPAILTANVASTQSFGDTATNGSSATAAKSDHKHGMMAAPISGGSGVPYTVGTAANNIIQLDASAKLPGVDCSQLLIGSDLLTTYIQKAIAAVLQPAGIKIIGYCNVGSLTGLNYNQLTDIIYPDCMEVTSATDPTLWVKSSFSWATLIPLLHTAGLKVHFTLACGNTWLSSIVADAGKRATLVANIATVLTTAYGGQYVDGVNIDWEDETSRTTALANSLLTDLYTTLQPLGKTISWYDGAYFRTDDPTRLLTPATANAKLYSYQVGAYYKHTPASAQTEMNAWYALGYSKSILSLGILFWATDDRDGNGQVGTYADVINILNPSASTDTYSNATFNGNAVSGGVTYWNSINDVIGKTTWVINNAYAGIMMFLIESDKLSDARGLLQNIYNTKIG